MSFKKSFEISQQDELSQVASFLKDQMNSQCLVLMYGEMGVGKTALVRELVKVFGGSPDVMSPTFALHNEYKVDSAVIDHLDLYRLETEAELESSGFWDLFSKDNGVILVEWSERLQPDWLPKAWQKIEVHLSFGETEVSRKIDIR